MKGSNTPVSRERAYVDKIPSVSSPFGTPPTAHPEAARDERESLKETRVYLLRAYDFW